MKPLQMTCVRWRFEQQRLRVRVKIPTNRTRDEGWANLVGFAVQWTLSRLVNYHPPTIHVQNAVIKYIEWEKRTFV